MSHGGSGHADADADANANDTDGVSARLLTELADLDRELVQLLQKRVGLTHGLHLQLQQQKRQQQTHGHSDTIDPTSTVLAAQQIQEQGVTPLFLDAATEVATASDADVHLDRRALESLFVQIAAECREVSRPLVVAYLGPEGTFTQAATLKQFGQNTATMPFADIDAIFRAVETGQCPLGVVPVENSIEGTINRTLDRISGSPLGICGEVTLRIEHNLLSRATSTDDVSQVYAHPQALAQCRVWLDTNLPQATRVASSSNAAGAETALGDVSAAAIASTTAAEIYSLDVLASNIEDDVSNTTRFIVIGNFEPPPSEHDVTSLVVSAPHRPGGLRKMLEPFEKAGVSMSRIESRPSRNELWSYVFFIDVSGHRDDPVLAEALTALAGETRYMRILGSYPTVRH